MSELVNRYQQYPFVVKFLVGLAVIAASSYHAWNEFVSPKLQILIEKNDNINKIESELNELNKNYMSPLSLEEELAAANREYRRLIELLPQDAAVDRVLNDFASISRTAGTEIREFNPNTELTLNSTSTQNVTPPSQAQLNQVKARPGSNNQNNENKTPQGANNQNNENKTPQGANNENNKAVIELEEANAVGLQIKMFGSFSSILSFLDMSMSLPRVVRIQDFEIMNSEADLKLFQKPKLTFQGIFFAYFQKPQNAQSKNSNQVNSASKVENKSTETIAKPAWNGSESLNNSLSARPLGGESK